MSRGNAILCAAGLRTRRAGRNHRVKRGGSGDPPRKTYLKPLSPWGGGTAANPPRVRRGRRAFTLVELITVMAILAILMAMIVGVVPRIQEAWRARLTRTRLQTIVAALQAYAGDYSEMFPYFKQIKDSSGKIIMVEVDDQAILGISLSGAPTGYGVRGFTRAEVVLYGALTSARRHGPYYKGAGGQTVVRKGTGGKEFTLFADGWERPILYEYDPATGLLLRSVGKNGVRETGSGGDDIVHYVFQND